MQRKPIILILTSRDEKANISEQIAESIRKVGTHNVVILGDDKYGSAQKITKLDRLLNLREEYQQVLADKAKKKQVGSNRKKGIHNRISIAIKRYRPELVLAVTPYSYYVLKEAKKKTGFKTSIF